MIEARATSGHLERAVGRRLNFRSGLLVPQAVVSYVTGFHHPSEWCRSGYEIRSEYLADLMWVTANDYATEFEIKLTRADWRADLDKPKWGLLPPWVTRFIYVAPAELGVPDFVPEWAGVWHFSPSRWSHSEITTVRAPKRIGQQKVPVDVMNRWLGHLHCRFWHQRLYVDHRLPVLTVAERDAVSA